MWSSQEGSLLLWAWVLSIASSAALYATRDKLREIVPWATAVMMGVAAFFTGLMLFARGVNPFATLSPAPRRRGRPQPAAAAPEHDDPPADALLGVRRLHRSPSPSRSAPSSARRLDAEWIRATRRFALIAWAFLGLGLLLGARWSYTELGWGGYWAWDPVENAALMPWLIGTAFLHSIMVQEKRGMLKVWNACLIVATFSLALLGTFLVRSGVLQSIHAFGDSTVGPYILGLIAVVLIGSTALIVSRLDDLRSREADRLAGLARGGLPGQQPAPGRADRGDLLGHLLPADLGTVHRQQGLAGGALVRPLHDAAGDRARPLHRDRAAARLAPGQLGLGQARLPAAAGVAAAVAVVAAGAVTDAADEPWAFALFVFAAFALTGLAQEFWRGAAARRSLAGGSMPAALLARRLPQPPPLRRLHRPHRHRRAADRHRRLLELPDQPRRHPAAGGERRWSTAADHLRAADRRGRRPSTSASARVLAVEEDGEPVATLRPSRRYFRPTGQESGTIGSFFDGEATSEVGLKAGLRQRSLDRRCSPTSPPCSSGCGRPTRASAPACAAAPGTPPQCEALARDDAGGRRQPGPAPGGAGPDRRRCRRRRPTGIARSYLDDDPPATFRVIVDPLVTWMWIGGLIALAGALIAIWPARGRRRGAVVRTEADALKEAKYREIRDAELDHAAGKLSDEDFALLDAELRREAVEILDRVENGKAAKQGRTARGGRDAPEGPAGLDFPTMYTFLGVLQVIIVRRPDLPDPAALGERRGPLRRLRRRRRWQLDRRRLDGRAQPHPRHDLRRRGLGVEHLHPAEDLKGARRPAGDRLIGSNLRSTRRPQPPRARAARVEALRCLSYGWKTASGKPSFPSKFCTVVLVPAGAGRPDWELTSPLMLIGMNPKRVRTQPLAPGSANELST